MTEGTLKIHTENILPIIKRWLYSDKEIFVRELVSNATDAIRKLQILKIGTDFKIDVVINKEEKTLQFIDNGIGMTSDEVEKYIAQIAFSGAEEFVAKYQSKEQMIGHFGLGFYSAYMVANLVTIDTLSYQEGSEPAFWSCTGTSTYTLDKGTRGERGTTITLHLGDEEFLDAEFLRKTLEKYCRFFPYPILLSGSLINDKEPLWLKNSLECTQEEYLDFYHTLYPLEPDPIFWIHLNVDVPFHLQGILYFPKMGSNLRVEKSNIQLFVSRVFVSESCKDLMPDFLTTLRGAIDSPDIPLNVSRSQLQTDKTVRQLAAHISKKVADKLTALYNLEREKFEAAWPQIEMIVKLGMLQEEKFYERTKEILIWKNVKGSFVSIPKEETAFYTTDADSPLLELYKDKEVLLSTCPIDGHLFNFLESKLSTKFHRIDSTLDPSLLDPTREKDLLDADGRTESSKIADFFRKALSTHSLEVKAQSLASDTLPAFLLCDERMRRFCEAMTLTGKELPKGFKTANTLVVNTNSPLIASLYKLQNNELAEEVAHHLYDLALLSQKELPSEDLATFVKRSASIMDRLLNKDLIIKEL